MTTQQFHLWQSFSRRMVVRGLGRRLRKSKNRLLGMLRDVFDSLRDEHGSDPSFISRLRSWEDTDPPPRKEGPYESRTLVCDLISSLEEHWNPHYWDDWRRNTGPYERWRERWTDALCCCVRAGMDLASEPSMGVVGFTVGDLKRMYPRGIPKWINSGFQTDERGDVDLNSESDEVSVWL